MADPASTGRSEAPRFRPWGLPGRGDPGAAVPAAAFPGVAPALPFGAGRSYGDSCTVAGGKLIDGRDGAQIHTFDPIAGLVVADAGVALGDLMRHVAPHHTLPVAPGTQFATVGGAIANDVHGKNHHRRGAFGAHVAEIVLVRSDRGRLVLTPSRPLFAATIGGMGMTGRIERATIRMVPVRGTAIRQTTTRIGSLAEVFDAAEAAEARHEYTVAWIDSLATGARLGRGHLIVGDHVRDTLPARRRRRLAVPLTPPVSLLNRLTLSLFNALYTARLPSAGETRVVPQETFFFPLDAVADWNRLYGPRGLHQHQSVLPLAIARHAVRELIVLTQRHDHGSFLTVLKRFGDNRSPGVMSFSRPGYTLTLDFPDRGAPTRKLLDALDRVVVDAGGAINPYKDRRMSPEAFDRSMPRWREVEACRDPAIVSDFWRRTALRLDPSMEAAA